ncbi:MAG: FecR family protein [Mucilaginibacter sp.]|nr:FecR family protein [Mucilaginibacter sp.]
MTKEDFIVLYDKYLEGNCTPEELMLLEQYHDDFILSDKRWKAEMMDKQEARRILLTRLQAAVDPPVKKMRRNYRWLAAAAILIFAIAAGLLWRYKNGTRNLVSGNFGNTLNHQALIKPGGERATLTLADGKIISLNKEVKGLLSRQGSATVSQLSTGQLTYLVGSEQNEVSRKVYNSIATPQGGEYKLILSDGTKVWLNSASSLKYPAVFSGHDRRVELSGEAYFEVAKNRKMPFKVTVKGMAIEVLGTHFNVMAYNNEKDVETTLLEGKVKLTNDKRQAYLLPGQRGILSDKRSDFEIQSADIQKAVAWKNGYFTFKQESIQSIMRKVARWYNVEVVYQGNVEDKTFGGSVSRFADISELLKTLELTGTIHFKIEGRRVIVMD